MVIWKNLVLNTTFLIHLFHIVISDRSHSWCISLTHNYKQIWLMGHDQSTKSQWYSRMSFYRTPFSFTKKHLLNAKQALAQWHFRIFFSENGCCKYTSKVCMSVVVCVGLVSLCKLCLLTFFHQFLRILCDGGKVVLVNIDIASCFHVTTSKG